MNCLPVVGVFGTRVFFLNVITNGLVAILSGLLGRTLRRIFGAKIVIFCEVCVVKWRGLVRLRTLDVRCKFLGFLPFLKRPLQKFAYQSSFFVLWLSVDRHQRHLQRQVDDYFLSWGVISRTNSDLPLEKAWVFAAEVVLLVGTALDVIAKAIYMILSNQLVLNPLLW